MTFEKLADFYAIEDITTQKTVKVAILGGDWWTDYLYMYLDSFPQINCTVLTTDYDLETLKQFDVVIIYGNLYYGHDTIIDSYVEEGGKLIATPWAYHNYWIWDSYQPPQSLPVTGEVEAIHHDHPVDMTFFSGFRLYKPSDSVGYEKGLKTKDGAVQIAVWNDEYNSTAIAYWDYGKGKAIYLNMHYITSDCDLAINYNWGKTLIIKALVFILS